MPSQALSRELATASAASMKRWSVMVVASQHLEDRPRSPLETMGKKRWKKWGKHGGNPGKNGENMVETLEKMGKTWWKPWKKWGKHGGNPGKNGENDGTPWKKMRKHGEWWKHVKTMKNIGHVWKRYGGKPNWRWRCQSFMMESTSLRRIWFWWKIMDLHKWRFV